MRESLIKKVFAFTFLFSLISLFVAAQSYNIDYYGIVSSDIEPNMAKMTSDLYYTQLSEINNFSITDKRTAASMTQSPSVDSYSALALSFYAEIAKDSDGASWKTTLHVVDKSKNEEHTLTRQYDSFYKILMEPKSALQDSIRKLIENNASGQGITEAPIKQEESAPKANKVSTESLSGTWKGEENIDKIVILRGGRGFVIFNNGASMNITISLSDNQDSQQILVTQSGRSNASYYPDLPRTIALNAAVTADPIQWTLVLSENNRLTGYKKTLLPSEDSYKIGTVQVEWNKIN